MEELDEFEVLWPEYYADLALADDDQHKPLPVASSVHAQSTATSWQRRAARSRPVDVPPPTPSRATVLLLRWKDGTDQDDLAEKDGGGGKIIVPPHLLVSGRRLSDGEAATAYTLLRAGRQGKRARDLRHLRNSVLRMTGFIEG